MAILYIGLGFAMISGISAMMQIGNNVNNLMLLSTFKQNNYYESSLPSYDRRILDILNNYSCSTEEVCSNVKENIQIDVIVAASHKNIKKTKRVLNYNKYTTNLEHPRNLASNFNIPYFNCDHNNLMCTFCYIKCLNSKNKECPYCISSLKLKI